MFAFPPPHRLLAQRVRDWIGDFFSVLAKLCNDPSDAVAAASFAAVGDVLREHPLCRTAVDEELRRFWGALGTEGETGESGDQGAAKSGFGGHKQVKHARAGILFVQVIACVNEPRAEYPIKAVGLSSPRLASVCTCTSARGHPREGLATRRKLLTPPSDAVVPCNVLEFSISEASCFLRARYARFIATGISKC